MYRIVATHNAIEDEDVEEYVSRLVSVGYTDIQINWVRRET